MPRERCRLQLQCVRAGPLAATLMWGYTLHVRKAMRMTLELVFGVRRSVASGCREAGLGTRAASDM